MSATTTSTKKKKNGWGSILFTIFIFGPLLSLVRGWTAKKLWDWFAVPAGLPRLSLPMLLGFGVFVSVMTAMKPDSKSDDDRSLWAIVGESVFYWTAFCGICLVEGKILLLFVQR